MTVERLVAAWLHQQRPAGDQILHNGDPSGMAVAMRYLVPAADYEKAGGITDPKTGIKRIVKP